jgi:NitT/TauT family transport system ATP-binding protein
MVKVESLTYSYADGPPVFEDFNWRIESEESWAILGPSGCGKTTLLYLLAGLRFPTAGRIHIGGEALSRPRPKTGLILQDYGLLPWATVRQNAMLGLRVRNFYGPDGTHAPKDFQAQSNVEPWLVRLGLLDQADKYPSQISGGQRQRTAIARTLVLQPDLLLMDEPFSSLDAPTREGLQALTKELAAENKITLIQVTHSIEEAAIMGEKILLLGQPPNHAATILENPAARLASFRDSAEYQQVCRELRARLGEQ